MTKLLTRKNRRLKNYDYSEKGWYFVTVCTYNKRCLFGDIVGANGCSPEIILNKYGKIVEKEWKKSANIRDEIELDKHVIMPNHVHGIIRINYNGKCQEKGDQPVALMSGPQSKSIGAIIAGFKSIVTKQINTIRNIPREKIWQRNYYDHIIRDERSLNEIREYIKNNPATWDEDENNDK